MQPGELCVQLLALATVGRNVASELESLRQIEAKLEELTHGANEGLIGVRHFTRPEVSEGTERL